jgi:dihydroflavonol-4-reductase
MSTVLVTGGSGFIASHCILQLLAAGHTVRTTVRSLSREDDVRAMLKVGGAEPGTRLTFYVADLLNDAGWAEAMAFPKMKTRSFAPPSMALSAF